jgi:hypothetical protein
MSMGEKKATKNLIKTPRNQLTNASVVFPSAKPASPPGFLPVLDDAEQLIHDAKVIGECYRVRVLFDTEHLKNDKDYIAIIEDTWLRTFKDIDPQLLEEAVHNFIVSDKKGYLPKPGQIVELLVKGVKEIERSRYYAEIERRELEYLFRQFKEDSTNKKEVAV